MENFVTHDLDDLVIGGLNLLQQSCLWITLLALSMHQAGHQ